ncbi:uncharacterized protein LOC116843466 isoform X2 [Odontomachus brunneus]|nr:uncharacterized protein LOC116843466 isoform X2 [Odontomachus brunneus]
MIVNKHMRFGGIISIFIQILGDYLAFIFGPVLLFCFGYKYVPSRCFSTFYKSNAMHTFVLEWLLTIIHRLSVYIVIRISRHLSEEYLTLISCTLLAFFRIVGYVFIGSLNNPALGASLRISCSGIRDYHSLLVYWVAPFCGSLCALFLLYLCKQVADLYVTSEPVSDTGIHLTLEDIRYKNSRNSNSL